MYLATITAAVMQVVGEVLAQSPSTNNSPVHGAIQEDHYLTTEDFLTPASSRRDGSPVTIATSLFSPVDSSDFTSDDTAQIIATITIGSLALIVLVIIIFSGVFYACRTSSWVRMLRGYTRFTPDNSSASEAEMDELGDVDANQSLDL